MALWPDLLDLLLVLAVLVTLKDVPIVQELVISLAKEMPFILALVAGTLSHDPKSQAVFFNWRHRSG